jgi:hypothetical protein
MVLLRPFRDAQVGRRWMRLAMPPFYHHPSSFRIMGYSSLSESIKPPPVKRPERAQASRRQ